jgi:hypothetical protein
MTFSVGLGIPSESNYLIRKIATMLDKEYRELIDFFFQAFLNLKGDILLNEIYIPAYNEIITEEDKKRKILIERMKKSKDADELKEIKKNLDLVFETVGNAKTTLEDAQKLITQLKFIK